jgi:small subunit ribosomal protein S7
VLYSTGRIPPVSETDKALAELGLPAVDGDAVGEYGDGLKFGAPERPLGAQDHLKRRYHPVLEQLTRLLMRNGKLSVAQRVRKRLGICVHI